VYSSSVLLLFAGGTIVLRAIDKALRRRRSQTTGD
jgi:hypothetical protein